MDPPINYNPWNKRFSPVDPAYQPEMPQSHRSHRGSHPYQRQQHPALRAQPMSSSSRTSSSNKKIPSLLTMELPPKPLFLPEEVEKLRASLRNIPHYKAESYNDYDENYEDSPPPTTDGPLTEEEYLQEEQKTKQQIEEIIAVAQALREKLDREEELRRQAEQSIPKLMDLKPIPSLLEIYVPPPSIVPEELCWNCRRPGHRFTQCNMAQQRRFCYRCGEPDFDVGSCPFCKNR